MRPRCSALSLGIASLLLLPACGGRGGGGGGGGGGGIPAAELSVDKVALYQGVENLLMEDQDEEGPTATVVAGRDALLRVFVHTHNSWEDREIDAQLTLRTLEYDSDDEEWTTASTKRYTETMDVVIGSSDSSKSSTFNFEIDGEDIEAGRMSYRVDLYEGNPDDAEGDVESPHWPDEGDYQEFEPRSSGDQLRIVFLPLEYRADGSGRLPDTSDSQIGMLRDAIMAQYPTREVDVEVDDPVPWSNAIYPNGAGFDRVLQYLYDIRDRYDYDVYLFALHAPASSYGDFCAGGCVAGLSALVRSPGDFWGRVSTGLGFTGDQTSGTTVHELGHAHGRGHAPCGTQGDGPFPYSGGSIGVWGYDIIDKTLKSPNTYADFMGYCDPTWVSDFTFDELFDRIRDVNGARSVERVEELPTFRTLLLTVDGGLEWSRDIRLPGLNGDAVPKTVELLDEAGDVIGTAEGRLSPFSHLSGGFLHVRDFGDDVAAVRVADYGTLAVDR